MRVANLVVFQGRLVREPKLIEFEFEKNDEKIAGEYNLLRIAYNNFYKGRRISTCFMDVRCYNKANELVKHYDPHKGDELLVFGDLDGGYAKFNCKKQHYFNYISASFLALIARKGSEPEPQDAMSAIEEHLTELLEIQA